MISRRLSCSNRRTFQSKAVVYLHGQYTGFILINTEGDFERHSHLLGPVFEDAGSGRVWIIVGYSGENNPVFGNRPPDGHPRWRSDHGPADGGGFGIAIARFGPTTGALGRTVRAALIGAGVQGHSHLEVLGHVLPGVSLRVHDRHTDRADRLAEAARVTPGIGEVVVAETARDAVADGDVVVTAVAFTDPASRQVMTGDLLTPDALVVAVDYASMLAAQVARDAALFLVDERGQFLANRDAGQFNDPDPHATLGESILAGTARPAAGRVVVTHLGVGLADVIFGDAVLRRAPNSRGCAPPRPDPDEPEQHRRDDRRPRRRRRPATMGAWTALAARRAGPATTLVDAFGAGHRGRRPATRRGSSARRTGPTRSTPAGRGGPRGVARRRAGTSASGCFVDAGALWFAHREDGFEAASHGDAGRDSGFRWSGCRPDELEARWPQVADGLAFGGSRAGGRPAPGPARRHGGRRAFVRELGRSSWRACSRARREGRRLLDVVRRRRRHGSRRPVRLRLRPVAAGLFPDLLGDLIRVTKQDVLFVGPPAGDGRFAPSGSRAGSTTTSSSTASPPSRARLQARPGPVRAGVRSDPGERIVDPESVRLARRVPRRRRFPDLADQPVVETRVCQYETTPDTQFIVDRHPGYRQRLARRRRVRARVQAGPAIGRYLVDRLAGMPAGPEEARFGLRHERVENPNMRTGADGMVQAWADW